MKDSTAQLPDDIDALKELVEGQNTVIEELKIEIGYLREQIRLFRYKQFGSRSEKLSEEQLRLFGDAKKPSEMSEEDADEDISIKGHKRAKRGRKPIPDSLPRTDVIHDLPEEEKICPYDGTALKQIGQETSEQLDWIPAKVQVIRNIRLKYACPCCEELVKTALVPPQPIPKSLASPGLLAHVTVSKYVDALPLYRQSKMLKRLDIDIPRATMANWMMKCGELIQPLINLLQDELLSHTYMQMDETGFQVLKEPGKSAQSKSFLWAQRGSTKDRPVILFHYDPSGSSEVSKRLLEGFSGYLQSDGKNVYKSAYKDSSSIRLLGCMAHARRKFDEALKVQPDKTTKKESLAYKVMKMIQKLYRIEHEIRDLNPEDRKAARQSRSKPRLAELKSWAEESTDKVPPKSKTGEALRYLMNQWKYLERYVEDGRLEIDNNLVENAIRPFAVGRKHWMFADTVRGAEASANLYSLVETAKANGLNPYKYLCYVFTELPKAKTVEEIEKLLPTLFAAEEIE